MSLYDHVTYSKYTGAFERVFYRPEIRSSRTRNMKVRTIYLPSQFKSVYPYVDIPQRAVAVLWMSFPYDTIDGKQHLSRFCYLDSSGYRVPDNSQRQFNEKIDAWLERVYELREKKGGKN